VKFAAGYAALAGDAALKRELLAYMADHPAVARYAAPDDVVFVPEIPHNATGEAAAAVLALVFLHTLAAVRCSLISGVCVYDWQSILCSLHG
jgi:acyl-coenzyme A synthetase/AMP-(fatty) acid ligase